MLSTSLKDLNINDTSHDIFKPSIPGPEEEEEDSPACHAGDSGFEPRLDRIQHSD